MNHDDPTTVHGYYVRLGDRNLVEAVGKTPADAIQHALRSRASTDPGFAAAFLVEAPLSVEVWEQGTVAAPPAGSGATPVGAPRFFKVGLSFSELHPPEAAH